MKALIRLRVCAGWSGPSLSAYARRYVFAWRALMSNEQGTAFPTWMHVLQAKSQISLRIHAVWSKSSQSTVGSQGPKASSGGQRRFWLDCPYTQDDLSLRFAHVHSAHYINVIWRYKLWKTLWQRRQAKKLCKQCSARPIRSSWVWSEMFASRFCLSEWSSSRPKNTAAEVVP